MAFKKISVEGVPLTLQLAREFAALPPLPGERDVKPARLQFLEARLRDGRFDGPTWARGHCRADGKTYRLDGQHSSKLLASLPEGLPFPEGLLVTINTYEFDSIEMDGAPLFNLFNHPRSNRTNEDAVGIYRAAAAAELREIPKPLLSDLAAGVGEYNKGLPPETAWLLQARDRPSYFVHRKEYEQFALWATRFTEVKNAVFLRRAPIVAEMLSNWLHDGDRATEFWDYVLRENHPEPDHETRQVAETFREWITAVKKRRNADYRKKASRTWNNFLKEARLALV